jgi:biopolymer transport protein ExbD
MAMAVGAKGVKSDINITPLVDVVLVLLIIFMVITPLGQRGYDIEIPKESNDQPTPPNPQDVKNIMLAVSEQDCNIVAPLNNVGTLPPDCRVRINDEAVTVTDLPGRMSEIFKARKKSEKVLFVAVQDKLNYEAIVRILDTAKNAVGEDLKLAIVSDEKLALKSASNQ